MWQNYLTVGIRSLLKQRTYALINIAGLAIGLAACILILLYVRYEQSYDKWMPDADRVFQLQTHYQATESGGAPRFRSKRLNVRPARPWLRCHARKARRRPRTGCRPPCADPRSRTRAHPE